MQLVTWSDKYSVKNSLIDSQHKKLLTIINDLHTAMKAGKSKEIMQKIIDDLVMYTKEHFKTEEDIMLRAKYSGFPEHKVEHDLLAKKVVDFQNNFRLGKAALSMDVMKFLNEWLINHIQKSDQKYSNKI
jgi:hemerythrin